MGLNMRWRKRNVEVLSWKRVAADPSVSADVEGRGCQFLGGKDGGCGGSDN